MAAGSKRNKQFDMVLWGAQVLLATFLLLSAYVKMGTPVPVLYDTWPWMKNHWLLFSSTFIDIAAAVAIVIPAALDRNNKWTIYAAYGIVAIMTGANVFQMYNGDTGQLAENIFCTAIAMFVIWGRKKRPTIKTSYTLQEEKEEGERRAKEYARKAGREEAMRLKSNRARKVKSKEDKK